MPKSQQPAFTVNPNLGVVQLQDAIAERLNGVRAMVAVLRAAEVGDYGQALLTQYGGAVETLVDELDVLLDQLWRIEAMRGAERETRDQPLAAGV